MRTIVVVLTAIIVLAGTGLFFISRSKQPKSAHYHTGFIVYKDGMRQDFSGVKYMHVEVCTTEEKHEVPTKDGDIVHLHDFVGDVAHVHADNATWGLLLSNLGISIEKGQTMSAYSQEGEISNILNERIKPSDSVVIIIGKNEGFEKKGFVSQSHIREVEKKTESCN